jgi:hypothetical protein
LLLAAAVAEGMMERLVAAAVVAVDTEQQQV